MNQLETTDRKQFVLGFAFNADCTRVVTILKTHPGFLKDKLNGVGGSMEAWEDDPVESMCREFQEETSVVTQEFEWNYFNMLQYDPNIDVWVYWARDDKFMGAKTTTSEEIKIISTDLTLAPHAFAPDADTMITLALDIVHQQELGRQPPTAVLAL